MKITQCKYGHYYDKAYFAKCPHCYRKNGGRDEDIIIKDVKLTANLSDTNQITKTQDKKESDRENVKRWIGEAWDELEEIKPSFEEINIAKKVGTNLIGLSKKEIDSLIKFAEWMTTIQVKLYLPNLLDK